MSPMVRRPPGIELALLGFLQHGPQHGYQIHLLLADSSGLGTIWHLKQSQLYALLVRLEKDGLIRGELENQESARPPRRVYHLTRAGQTAYHNWLRSPVGVPRLVRQEFMAKYFFVLRENEDLARKLVNLQMVVCQAWLKKMLADQVADQPFHQALQLYRQGQITATLKWLESL